MARMGPAACADSTQWTAVGGFTGHAFCESFGETPLVGLRVAVAISSEQLSSVSLTLADGRVFLGGMDGASLFDRNVEHDEEFYTRGFDFQAGERLETLQLCSSPWGAMPEYTIVSRIHFTTSLGRTFEAGRLGPEDLAYPIDVGSGEIVGFRGRHGQVIDQLAFIFRTTTEAWSAMAVPCDGPSAATQMRRPEASNSSSRPFEVLEIPNRLTFPCHSAVVTSSGSLEKFMMIYAFIKRDTPTSIGTQAVVRLRDRSNRNESTLSLTPALLASYLGYVGITRVLLEESTSTPEPAYMIMERAIINS